MGCVQYVRRDFHVLPVTSVSLICGPLIWLGVTGNPVEADEALPLRPGVKQLFLDDHALEKMDGVRRVLHQPRKYAGNPVIKPDARHLWERCSIQTRDAPVWNRQAKRWELLYLSDSLSTCLAVSEDGLKWNKPIVGRHEVEGSKQNNLLWPYDPTANKVFLYHRLYDARDPDPRRRWKALIGERNPRPAASPDGYTWTFLSEKEIPSGEEHHLVYDESKSRFVFTLRTKDSNGRRAVNLSTSRDFVHWSEPKLIFYASQRDQDVGKQWLMRHLADPNKRKPMLNQPAKWNTQIYNMAVFPYEGVYIGLPTYFRMCGHSDKAPAGDGFSEMGLTVSRDLVHWKRVSGLRGFIPLSPVGDNVYDTAQIEPPARPIRRGDELWFYYTGLKYRYTPDERDRAADIGAICIAMLRLDGFVSFDAGNQEGVVLTKPLIWHGSRLLINTDASAGEVCVEMLGADGTLLDGKFSKSQAVAVSVDAVRAPVRWKTQTDLSSLEGKAVRLRFHLRRAELYAFWSE